eukprot:TRINITY_DN2677_c0_g1_i4.p1 TRINITY_DN2677_c0_g1~~TRINITY_DN2677_c0_g1_i4.p1  ORF type:complete len:475 (+),score=128.94 TRINITY_DN2677_c0_g1_i4:1140-2564(+)
MSYGETLWDGFAKVAKRSDETMEICHDMVAYFKRRVQIETEYSKQLVALAKSESGPSAGGMFKSANVAGKEKGTLQQAWIGVQFEMEKFAKAHSDLAAHITSEIIDPLSGFIKEKEAWKKTLIASGQKILKEVATAAENLQKQAARLDKYRKEEEALAAKPDAKTAAKRDANASKLREVEADYQGAESAALETVTRVFQQTMPVVLADFQSLEEQRIEYLHQIFSKFVSVQEAVVPTFDESIKGLAMAVDLIDRQADIQTFIHDSKTGKPVATSIEEGFEALNPKAVESGKAKPLKPSRPPIEKPGAVGDFNDFSSLSGDQRKQKVVEALESTRKALQVEQNSRDGMQNLVQMYTSQPEMKSKVEAQISESETKIHKLSDNLHRYETLLSQIDPSGSAKASGSGGGGASDTLFPCNPPINAVAVYDFEGSGEGELSFKEGESLKIIAKGNSGWWEAENSKRKTGLVPSNYVEEK